MHFEMHKIIHFFQIKQIIKKEICVPTLGLPKMFRPVTRNTLLILFGLGAENIE